MRQSDFRRPRNVTAAPFLQPRENSFLLSVVIPCMNEEEVLPRTVQQLVSALECGALRFELIFVDDGSTDSTPEILRELQTEDPRIRIVRLSRNFGHQVAITAGLEHAIGDAVAIIDADLQDPPDVLLTFIKKWVDGYDVVYGVRADRDGETAFKLWTAKLFYRLIGHENPTRHRRFPFDGPARRRRSAVHAGARPLCARNGKLAWFFPDRCCVPPRGEVCRCNQVSVIQDAAICSGRYFFFLHDPAPIGDVDWVFRLRACHLWNSFLDLFTHFW